MTGLKDNEAPVEARYKVGEICRLADVQPYVLRYWESEFPVLAAPKGQAGPRTYSVRDLKVIERIKKLLYDEGYTIAGAKKRLESELRGPAADEDTAPVVPIAPDDASKVLPGLALEPPPLPPEASTRQRRPRIRPASAAPPVESSLVFEEASSEPAPEVEIAPPPPAAEPEPPAQKAGAGESTKPVLIDRAPAPVVQPADPRVARVVAELKEILVLLSSEEPESI